MLYAWIGILKNEGESTPQSVQLDITQFLAQPLIDIRAAGQLRDATGRAAGMLMIFEHENRAAAEAFTSTSPLLNADMYEDHRLYEFSNVIG